MQDYGNVVAKARKSRNWSQRKLSQVTGLSRSFINDIEHGRSIGTMGTWVALARALELSLDAVFLAETAAPYKTRAREWRKKPAQHQKPSTGDSKRAREPVFTGGKGTHGRKRT